MNATSSSNQNNQDQQQDGANMMVNTTGWGVRKLGGLDCVHSASQFQTNRSRVASSVYFRDLNMKQKQQEIELNLLLQKEMREHYYETGELER